MNNYYFGFDTSNYTTSFAVCSDRGEIIFTAKKMLEVKDGNRGLRQSDAVFQHTVNMEFIAEKIASFVKTHHEDRIVGVGYSAYPRNIDGSYMPCFLVGKSIALSVAASFDVSAYAFSHQEGHIAAALYGAGALDLIGDEFAAFHVSGGTTDLLFVDGYSDGRLNITQIGGSRDLNAGQVIDRAGVMMGLPFPSGKHVEALALKNDKKVPKYPRAVEGLECNLSGIENKAKELYVNSGDKALTSAFVIDAVSDVIFEMTDNLLAEYPNIPVVYSGGVMSCSIIKERLNKDNRFFAPAEFSSDNAAGIAYLTMLGCKQ